MHRKSILINYFTFFLEVEWGDYRDMKTDGYLFFKEGWGTSIGLSAKIKKKKQQQKTTLRVKTND